MEMLDIVIKILKILLLIYLIILILSYFFAEKLIFPAPSSSYTKNISQFSFIENADGKPLATRLWQQDKNKYLVIYFHGNGEDIGYIDEITQTIFNNGYSVLAYDYRGYGLSVGTPSIANIKQDANKIIAYANSLGYSNENIILWGFSLGSGVATQLATQHKFKALILVAPFKSIYTVITKYPILPFDKLVNTKNINKLDLPIYIVHGNKDRIIPFSHGKELFDKYQGKKCFKSIENAGHNNLNYFGFLQLIPNILNFAITKQC